MRVLLVRADGTPDDDARALRVRGVEVTAEPFIQIAPSTDFGAVNRAETLVAAMAEPGAWLIVTSAAAMRALDALLGASRVTEAVIAAEASGTRFAAVGPASASSLTERGVSSVLAPTRAHTAAALLELLDGAAPSSAVLPRSSLADPVIALTLQERGWTVLSEEVYRTTSVDVRPSTADKLAAGAFDAIVLRSPSAARAVAHFAVVPAGTAVVAGGPTTARAARDLGMNVTEVALDSRADSIVTAVLAAGYRVATPR